MAEDLDLSQSLPLVGSGPSVVPKIIITFPPELVVLILRCLSYRDLVTCSRVCRSFHDLITTAPDLVYVIELAVAGLVHAQSNHMPMAESLRVLRDIQARWSTFNPVLCQTILPPQSRGIFSWYSQGLYTQSREPEGLVLYTKSIVGYSLSSRTREFLDHGPLVDDMITALKFRSHKHFVDISKDLIMIFECAEKEVDDDETEEDEDEDEDVAPKTCVRAHFRTLSSGATLPHPACDIPVVGTEVDGNRTYLKSFHIKDDILAMYLNVYISTLTVIWNWKTGEKLVHMVWQDVPFYIYDFALLSSNEFIIVAWGYRGHWSDKNTLSLFRFGPHATSGMKWTFGDTSVMHIVSLCLPELVPNGYVPYDLSIASLPSHTQMDGPFVASADIHDSIIVMDGCSDQATLDMFGSTVTFVLHSTTLFSFAQRALSMPESTEKTIFIPWEDWGPKNCRVFMTKPPSSDQYPARHFTGERVALTLCDANGVETPQILDFNPRSLKRVPFIDGKGHAATVVTEATTYDLSAVFANLPNITTSLPYSTIHIPDHEGYSDFMLDEQRLVCLKRPTSQSVPNRLDVFAF